MHFLSNYAAFANSRELPSRNSPPNMRKGRDMAPRYTQPSVEVIPEIEGESMLDPKCKEPQPEMVVHTRRHERRYDSTITPARTSAERHREKPRKSHRSNSSGSGRASTVVNPRLFTKRTTPASARDGSAVERRHRHRRTQSQPNDASSSSSSDEGDIGNHDAVLAASRERLTSPSLISTLTSLTTATNNSGGSSGSNSTVTQASMSRELASKRLESASETPLSPAVPDPPDVFSFLEPEIEGEEEEDDGEEEDGEEEVDEEEREEEDGDLPEGAEMEQPWLSEGIYDGSPLQEQTSSMVPESMSSSGSSSFHSDYTGSEPAADNDTDRSTSPERSVKGEEDTARPPVAPPTDPAASKLASQMLAAHHRQNLHGAFQTFGPPQMPRGNHIHPHVPSTVLSPRVPQQIQHHGHTRADKPPVTGYDALASKISISANKASIKPIYRKFECLNHRLLLHLQDEISELEEQLERLDAADTQSRSVFGPTPGDIRVVPASRRAAAHAGGELEWHKMDLMNRIAYKLAQYNQALTSFNKVIQDLDVPDPGAVKHYRVYLQSEHPIMENETRFLEASGDLVTLGRKDPQPNFDQSQAQLAKSATHQKAASDALPPFRIIAAAVAVAVLIPILTFAVIPGFLGRMTVVTLVAGAMVGALFQAGIVGVDGWKKMGKDWASCAIIYGGVMVVLAGIVL